MDYHTHNQIGKAKNVVSFNDGVQTHKDGSPFYQIEICGNKRKLRQFTKQLESRGYVYA